MTNITTDLSISSIYDIFMTYTYMTYIYIIIYIYMTYGIYYPTQEILSSQEEI
jgi:hypothetical protein